MNGMMDEADLERAKALPTCTVCTKKSDGAKQPFPSSYPKLVLCGAHYDAWLASPEANNAGDRVLTRFMDFVNRATSELRNTTTRRP